MEKLDQKHHVLQSVHFTSTTATNPFLQCGARHQENGLATGPFDHKSSGFFQLTTFNKVHHFGQLGYFPTHIVRKWEAKFRCLSFRSSKIDEDADTWSIGANDWELWGKSNKKRLYRLDICRLCRFGFCGTKLLCNETRQSIGLSIVKIKV